MQVVKFLHRYLLKKYKWVSLEELGRFLHEF